MKFFMYVRPLLDLTARDSPVQLGPFFGLKVDHARISVLRKLNKKEREEAKRLDRPEIVWFQIATAEIAYTPATYGANAEGKLVQNSEPSSGTVWTFVNPKNPDALPMQAIEWSIDD